MSYRGYESGSYNVYTANADGSGNVIKINDASTAGGDMQPKFGGGYPTYFAQASKITEVAGYVTTALNNDKDPVKDISYNGSNYSCSDCP